MFQLYVHCVYIMSGRGSWYTSPNWVVDNLPLSIINIDKVINLIKSPLSPPPPPPKQCCLKLVSINANTRQLKWRRRGRWINDVEKIQIMVQCTKTLATHSSYLLYTYHILNECYLLIMYVGWLTSLWIFLLAKRKLTDMSFTGLFWLSNTSSASLQII